MERHVFTWYSVNPDTLEFSGNSAVIILKVFFCFNLFVFTQKKNCVVLQACEARSHGVCFILGFHQEFLTLVRFLLTLVSCPITCNKDLIRILFLA